MKCTTIEVEAFLLILNGICKHPKNSLSKSTQFAQTSNTTHSQL